jgi:hypothetical protein
MNNINLRFLFSLQESALLHDKSQQIKKILYKKTIRNLNSGLGAIKHGEKNSMQSRATVALSAP